MRTVRSLMLSLVGLAVVAIVAQQVYAHCGTCAGSCKQMVTAMEEGEMTLAKAIAKAEEKSKGKAVMAMCEMDGDEMEMMVYCLADDKIMAVEMSGEDMEMNEVRNLPSTHEH